MKTKDGTRPEVRSRLSLFLRGGVIGEGFSVCQEGKPSDFSRFRKKQSAEVLSADRSQSRVWLPQTP
jgi:hypothetical protein